MSGPARPPRRRRAELSQHFLRGASATRLVRATSISKTDIVVEIGPGRGALTKPLLKRAGSVIAVELDAYLVQKLRREHNGNIQIVAGDFMNFPLPADSYSIIGNLPFARSTEIIRRLATVSNPPKDAWLVVQRELANRMCGRPFDKENLWSLRLKPFWHLEIIDRLKKTEFEPPPSVESVFLHMSLRRPVIDRPEANDYVELLEQAFRRNVTMAQVLRQKVSKIQMRRLAADLRFQVEDKPADLMFEQWLGVFRFLRNHV